MFRFVSDRRTLGFGSAVLAGVIGAALVVASSEPDRKTNPLAESRSGETPQALERYVFQSLPEMMATADLVIEGTVTDSQPYKVVGPSSDSPVEGESPVEASGQLQIYESTIDVDRTILGGSNRGTEAVRLMEGGTLASLSQPGDHGFFFLTRDSDAAYVLLNSQARFLRGEDGGVIASNPELPWVAELAEQTYESLGEDIEDARGVVARGGAEAARPQFGSPDQTAGKVTPQA